MTLDIRSPFIWWAVPFFLVSSLWYFSNDPPVIYFTCAKNMLCGFSVSCHFFHGAWNGKHVIFTVFPSSLSLCVSWLAVFISHTLFSVEWTWILEAAHCVCVCVHLKSLIYSDILNSHEIMCIFCSTFSLLNAMTSKASSNFNIISKCMYLSNAKHTYKY